MRICIWQKLVTVVFTTNLRLQGAEDLNLSTSSQSAISVTFMLIGASRNYALIRRSGPSSLHSARGDALKLQAQRRMHAWWVTWIHVHPDVLASTIQTVHFPPSLHSARSFGRRTEATRKASCACLLVPGAAEW